MLLSFNTLILSQFQIYRQIYFLIFIAFIFSLFYFNLFIDLFTYSNYSNLIQSKNYYSLNVKFADK